MIDHALRQHQIVEKEYLYLIQEGVSQEAWISGGYQRKWPVKARYFWNLQAVYAPQKQSQPPKGESNESPPV